MPQSLNLVKMNILEEITNHKKKEIEAAKRSVSIGELQNSEFYNRKTLCLKSSLPKTTGIIAEFKRRSPSKPNINIHAKPEDIAPFYEQFGASAVSILTDQVFFGGNLKDLKTVRRLINIPLLRKDFMIDEYQFYEAKAFGADIVLLIAAILSPSQVIEFTQLSHQLGLEVLLEIHTEDELQHYTPLIDFIGINNRNLKDFKVDLQNSVNLKNLLPAGTISIAESGISSVEDFKFLKKNGFNGFLMGEYFMKNENPGVAFKNFAKEI